MKQCTNQGNKSCKHLDYESRLKELNLPTLQFRRLRGDMIEMFKHFNSYDKQTLPSSFTQNPRPSRQHDFQIKTSYPKDGKHGVQTNFFYNRCAKTWNDLPEYVAKAKSINSFKNRLDKHWKDHPMKYQVQKDQD